MQYLEDDERFYVPGPKGDIAEMTFKRIGENKVVIDHTYVDVNYRGQGIAEYLFKLVIEKMKQENRKIIPECSYAQRTFERHPHLQTLLAE